MQWTIYVPQKINSNSSWFTLTLYCTYAWTQKDRKSGLRRLCWMDRQTILILKQLSAWKQESFSKE